MAVFQAVSRKRSERIQRKLELEAWGADTAVARKERMGERRASRTADPGSVNRAELWPRRLGFGAEHVTPAAHGVDDRRRAPPVELAAEAVDVNLDHVGHPFP